MIRTIGNRLLCTSVPKLNLPSMLKKELEYEVGNNTIHQVYPHTKDYLNNVGWNINHTTGKSEIVLSKQINGYSLEMFINSNENEDLESSEIEVVLDISKEGKEGIVSLDLLMDSEELSVNNLCWYPNKEFQKSEELREDNYVGPVIETLDQQVEDAIYEKLSELSVTSELSDKIRDLKNWKEQKEYENWLEKVGKFFQ